MDIGSLISFPRNLDILDKLPQDLQCFGKWFLAISEIPHACLHSELISSTICSWLQGFNVSFEKDIHGNICARIPANGLPDTSPVLAIQAHIDMVTVGEFLENGAVEVTLKDRILIAEKSTLGADDGVGVALMLEIIEKRFEIQHGPMEFIFTVDEELGLLGMLKLPKQDGSTNSGISPFTCKYLINCDVLNFDKIFIGSSGATIYRLDFQVHRHSISSDKVILELSLQGLKGGHSGGCIHMNRINAIKVLSRIIKFLLMENIPIELVDFNGGEQLNIIPRFAEVKVAVLATDSSRALELIHHHSTQILLERQGTDEFEPVFDVKTRAVANDFGLDFDETKRLLNVLLVYQHGPLRMSPIFPEYVDASDNLAVIRFNEKTIRLICFPRSALQSKLDESDQRIRAICELSGFEYQIESQYSGGPWTPNINSKLGKLTADSFELITGIRKQFGITQVTIEAGEFLKLGYDLDMVGICPSVPKAHTIGEYVNIDECSVWRKVIFDLLSKLTE